MANLCMTTYCVYGDKEQLQELYDLLEKDSVQSEYGGARVGLVLEEIGFDTETLKSNGCGDMRSTVDVFEIQRDDQNELYLSVDCDEAWEPHLDAWNVVFEHFFGKDYRLRYYAVEPDGELYITNDRNLEGKYHIDGELPPEFCGDMDHQGGVDENYVVDLLQRISGSESTDLSELNDIVNDDMEIYFSANKWVIVDVDEMLICQDACKDKGVSL